MRTTKRSSRRRRGPCSTRSWGRRGGASWPPSNGDTRPTASARASYARACALFGTRCGVFWEPAWLFLSARRDGPRRSESLAKPSVIALVTPAASGSGQGTGRRISRKPHFLSSGFSAFRSPKALTWDSRSWFNHQRCWVRQGCLACGPPRFSAVCGCEGARTGNAGRS